MHQRDTDLQTRFERQCWDGLDMCRGKTGYIGLRTMKMELGEELKEDMQWVVVSDEDARKADDPLWCGDH